MGLGTRLVWERYVGDMRIPGVKCSHASKPLSIRSIICMGSKLRNAARTAKMGKARTNSKANPNKIS